MNFEPTDYQGGETGGSAGRAMTDALKRDAYKQTIEGIARDAVDKVQQAREALDMDAARQAAREAFDLRNAARAETQAELSWGGKMFSKAVERERTWSDMLVATEKKILDASPELARTAGAEYEVYAAIAESAGRSNATMGPLQYATKGLGVLGLGLAAFLTLKNIRDAPPGQGLAVAGKELVGLGIGWGASSLGSAGAAWALKALGVASPWGVALGAFAGGLALALVADWAYRRMGKRLGRDPMAYLFGALFGLLLGTACGAQPPAVGPVWNCDCPRVQAGLLTREWQNECFSAEKPLLDATASCAGDMDCVRQKLGLKEGKDGTLQKGQFCGSMAGPYAWPVGGGPSDPPPRPPGDPKPCKHVSGIARTCDDE